MREQVVSGKVKLLLGASTTYDLTLLDRRSDDTAPPPQIVAVALLPRTQTSLARYRSLLAYSDTSIEDPRKNTFQQGCW